jgi:exodeoxyribonuclease VII small subunit
MEENTFEAALKRLESIIGKLESGETDLEDMLKLFDEGAELLRHCHKTLDEAEAKITEMSRKLEQGAADE